MNYSQAEDLIFKQLPFFQKDGDKALKYELVNILKLCSFLGNPQDRIKCVHVAGTNGKGSCSHLLASIFQESGLKVGLYTSPHLKNYRERFRINGEMIQESEVVDFAEKIQHILLDINPTFFEVSVALAFYWFELKAVEIAVIEVGMGGRLDSTNIIKPILSIITNIGFDHQKFLGNTLDKIAFEKAGIIKQKTPVVIGERIIETEKVFREKAAVENASIYFSDQVSITNTQISEGLLQLTAQVLGEKIELTCPLSGSYQINNIKTVLKSVEILKKSFTISLENIIFGINNVITNTKLKGRWQTLCLEPLTICDTGHNAPAWVYLVQQINFVKANNKHIILGFSDDKDIEEILHSIPEGCNLYFSEFDSQRSKKVSEMQSNKYAFIEYFTNINTAIELVRNNCSADDFIFVGGSTYLVAEIDNL